MVVSLSGGEGHMRFLLLFLLSITSGMTFAQNFPTRPARMIEPFGADGGPDLIARAVSPKLSELWGQPVTVENHPGAGSTAPGSKVTRAPLARAGSRGLNRGSTRTVPVKYFGGPL
jgi:tripartite-type tricarboxylate transporter receptor subunit TctC